MSIQRKTLYWTVAAVVVAVLAWLLPKSASGSSTQTGDVNLGPGSIIQPSVGSGGCVAINGQCAYSPGDDPETVRQKLRQLPSSGKSPTSGPSMFAVVGTGKLGLYVRDGFTQDDHRLPGNPTLSEGLGVYVDCRIENGWDADPSTTASGRWYKIRYPEVANRGNFWVYGGYLVPVGHNGEVPMCPASG